MIFLEWIKKERHPCSVKIEISNLAELSTLIY